MSFMWAPLKSQTISVTTSSANTTLSVGGDFTHYELNNNGTDVVFIEWVTTSVTAATVAASYPILPGQCKTVPRLPTSSTQIACISKSGTQELFITPGQVQYGE